MSKLLALEESHTPLGSADGRHQMTSEVSMEHAELLKVLTARVPGCS